MNLIFGEAAKKELDDAFQWYEVQSAGLGFSFAKSIDNTLKRILRYPQLSAPLTADIKRA